MIAKMWQVQKRPGLYIDHPVRIKSDEKNYYVYSMWDKSLVEEFRAFKGSQWDKKLRCWKIPICERNNFAMTILSGDYPKDYYANPIEDVCKKISEDYQELFPWQKEGLAYILSRKRCMLAFDMGLGKTLTMIRVMDYLAMEHDIWQWWVVAPFGAQQTWKREILRWNGKVEPLLYTTFESLKHHTNKLFPQGIIFDESVKIKTPSAQRSQVAYQVCEEIRKQDGFIILLSGLPNPKDPSDWWHQIECLQPGFLREGDVWKFRNRLANIVYEDGEFGRYPKIVSWKEDEVKILGQRLAPIVLRKNKGECLDLPEKIYETIVIPPSEETLRVAKALAREDNALEKLHQFSDGFQYNENGHEWVDDSKIEIIKELLDFYNEENGGPGRLVIYCVYHAVSDKLQEIATVEGWKAARIDGRGWDPVILDVFNGTVKNVVLVCHPGAIHGLNLQRTEALVYYSNDFRYDNRAQSEDRRDRPGMSEKGTKVIDIIHLPTDSLILDNLKNKKDISNITLKEIETCLK